VSRRNVIDLILFKCDKTQKCTYACGRGGRTFQTYSHMVCQFVLFPQFTDVRVSS